MSAQRVLSVMIAAALLVAGISACGDSERHGSGDTSLRGTYSSFPDYLDPGLSVSTEGLTAMAGTYIPLLTYARHSGEAGTRLIPGLARSLPKISDGGKAYTLYLRRGLRYSDGEPVRASDFAYTVERLLKLNSPGSPFYTSIVGAERFAKSKRGGIAGIETDDRSGKIVIRLVEPRGTFANERGLVYAALVPAGTPMEDMTAHPPPATGPYVISDVTPGRNWEYERNPYWAKGNSAAMPQLPSGHMDRITIDVVANPETQVNEIEQGKSDWMKNPPTPTRYPELKREYEGTQLLAQPTISTFYFWLNTREPPFDDLRVRRAVNYAVDPEAMERIFAGTVRSTQQILPPGMPGYEKFEPYPHDMAKARKLIGAADPSDREVTVWTNRAVPNNEAGEYLQDLLEKLGFQVNLKILDISNYFTVIGNLTTPDLDAGFANWFQDYPHPNDFFEPQLTGESIQPTSNTNWAMVDIPRLDAKIDRLGHEQLGPKQEAEYAALDRAFMKQAPWAPFGTYTLATFVAASIDLEKLVVSPYFGQELTSFQFR
jgi:peptide/nickel transport system substrate-binding protein